VVLIGSNDLYQDCVYHGKVFYVKEIKIKKTTIKNSEKDLELAKKQSEMINEEEKPFDFGGMPPRDLKKNLGCG
jgi:hypothetical protein